MNCPRCHTKMNELKDRVICPKCGFEVVKENNKAPKLQSMNDADSSKQNKEFPMNEDAAIL